LIQKKLRDIAQQQITDCFGADRMACLELTELRELKGAEKLVLDDAAKKFENVVENTISAALESHLNMDLTHRGLITTLISTTARFAALYNKSQDKEASGFAVMRCMAEALMDVSGSSAEDNRGLCH
jgi:uncharacterized sporulation protein YeaH/YhbH (DUF444 family)